MGKRESQGRRARARDEPQPRMRLLLALLALSLVVFLAYQPAWHGGVLWDDDDHLTPAGLQAASGLWRIWFEVGATPQHYPVLHTAFWIQHKLFGEAMTGYHLVNIAMHCLAAALLALTLWRLAVPGALLAAALFALHPVQVESVAWITELKNTLSTVFYLSAALLYLRFARTRHWRDYGLAAAVFALALLSKTVAGTLPFALLIVLWWQQGRLDLRRDIVPVLPLIVLGIAAGLMTAWWEHEFNRTRVADFDLTFVERTLIAGRALWFHASKLVWPVNLTFSYPRWRIDASAWWQYLFPLGVAAALAVSWLWRSRSRAPLAALLFFCVSLGPTLGFFNLYTFRYSFVADHYQYVACIGLLTLAAAGLTRFADRRAIGRGLRAAASMTLLAPLAAMTWQQSHQYVDSHTLYAATLERNPASWLSLVNVGHELQAQGRVDEAVSRYRAAIAIEPRAFEAHHNLALALQRLGQYDGGLSEAREALRLRPDAPETHFVLGLCLHGLARVDEAMNEFREAIRLRPDYAQARLNLAAALDQQGRTLEAVDEFREAIRYGPGVSDAHFRFGNALMRASRPEDAVSEYRAAIAIEPATPAYHYYLGFALEQLGRFDDALKGYEAALQRRPDSAPIENSLGALLIRMKRYNEAIAHLQKSLRLDPAYAPAQANLARAIAGAGR
ncbi:MAG TPA: tetratricopeptide repeat protein [Vicinamibacterales bacterium]|nr:tetratricopeptide repeat protein [Vicinamibacterales bacterium]